MRIVNIVRKKNEDGGSHIHRGYTEQAFLDRCNYQLSTNYAMNELFTAECAFTDKYPQFGIETVELVTEFAPSISMMKQKIKEARGE